MVADATGRGWICDQGAADIRPPIPVVGLALARRRGYDLTSMGHDADAIAELFRTASLGAPENAIGFVLWRVVNRYMREVDRALVAAGLDLTHLQFETLIQAAWLGRAGVPATQAELARFGGIQPMQVSHMLKTLEGKGLVARPRDPADVRTKRVEVTAAGVEALRRGKPVVIDVQSRLFGAAGRPGGVLLNSLLPFCGDAEATGAGE